MRESNFIQGWINEGKIEGIKEGIKEGKREGQLEQAKTTLRRLVSKRFGKVDAELERRIQLSSDLDALRRAIDAILDVADASALFPKELP